MHVMYIDGLTTKARPIGAQAGETLRASAIGGKKVVWKGRVAGR